MHRIAWLALGSLLTLAVGFAWPRAHLGHGFGHHRFGHGWSEEDARDAVSWWLRGVGATDAQVEAIAAIATRTHDDLASLRGEHRERMRAFAEALTAAEVDADALESLRAEALARADDASKRIVRALGEAAAVLSPAQRAELAERHERLHARFAH
jgi:Spy/CpxP family protein refolding chaperone